MDQIWAIKNWNIYSSRRQKRQVWPRSCWEAVELGGKWACEGCWQHDIFVGSDVMAHKRSFYGSCYCKERRHSKLLWERKSFATKIRRWEDRILLRGAKGMCRWWIAEQGQWDTVGHRSITDSRFNYFNYSRPMRNLNLSEQTNHSWGFPIWLVVDSHWSATDIKMWWAWMFWIIF